MNATLHATRPVGNLLREWRQRRRMSQLDFSVEAEISSKHLSFLETGRSQPSREMVLHLAELLEVPLRERNALLIAAGFAPMFQERALNDPDLEPARQAVELVLKGHEPYPAIAVDRHWNLVASNSAAERMLVGVDPELLKAPMNALRVCLHPNGIAPRIVNLAEWRAHLLARLRRLIDMSADPVLETLLQELAAYPAPPLSGDHAPARAIAVPLRLASPAGVLSFISTTTVFGTPIDVTLSELALESFFPADAATTAALRQLTQ